MSGPRSNGGLIEVCLISYTGHSYRTGGFVTQDGFVLAIRTASS